MKNLFVFMVFLVALFVVSQTCVAKSKKKEHVVPQDVQAEVTVLINEINNLAMQKQLADAEIRVRQEKINHVLNLWKVGVGILEKDFPLWELQGDKLIKKGVN